MTINSSYNKIRQCVLIALIFIALVSASGCSFSRHAIAALRSTDHFMENQEDPRVLFELGAEEYANKVVSFLPSAIQQIEERQYSPFDEPIRVYICASRESFKKYSGSDARAIVLSKLIMSPRVFDQGDEIAKKYLMHELSHLHLLQRLGTFKMSRLPFWFKEGLATYFSDGGGANLVSEKEAIESIARGKHFIPNKSGGFIFQKTPSDFNIIPHMFYRQSMMFIRYLVNISDLKFREFVLSIESGESLASSIHNIYNKELQNLWSGFMMTYKETG